MSIPNDDIIQEELLKLLYNSSDKVLHCNIVYDKLAKYFPDLTYEEKNERYRESKSHWANRVQFARLHLVNNNLLLNKIETQKKLNIYEDGYWMLSEEGIQHAENNIENIFSPAPVVSEIRDTINKFENEVNTQEEFSPSNIIDAREKTLKIIVQRRGQTKFRNSLLLAYNSKCAITKCDAPEALEAAHIVPYLNEETNKIQNGILLRADIHTLFDLRLFTIHEEFSYFSFY